MSDDITPDTSTSSEPAAGAGTAPTDIEGYEAPTPGGWDGFPLDELAIRDERRTAEDVVRRIGRGRFVLDPDFQRDFVWDEGKQSRLVESILMRIPLPVFYVAEDAEGRLIAVDGRQRLTTLERFLSGDLALVLPDRPELDGKRFDQLEPRLQNRVEDCQLHFFIIDHAVPERARLDIFERVNGGEVLTRQQMRNAVFDGQATRFLRDQASTELFADVTGRSLDAKKMQDREFVNRFCAFALLDLESYAGDMDEWLARALVEMNRLDDEALATLGARFQTSLRNNQAVFAQHAFRKHTDPAAPRRRVNVSLYDVLITGFADVAENDAIDRADALRSGFYGLMDDPRFVSAITDGTNRTQQVQTRFDLGLRLFAEVFDAQ